MADKNEIEENDFGIPELDEGWWNSVLSDESAYSVEPKVINCKPCSQTSAGNINWACIQELFEKDEVVLLQVQ